MAKKTKKDFLSLESCFCADRKRMIRNLEKYVDNIRRVLREYGHTFPRVMFLDLYADYANAVAIITRLHTHLYNIEVLGNPVKPLKKLPKSFVPLTLWL